MSKRDTRHLPDFHLWTAVAQTIAPLRRKSILRLGGEGTLPMPEAEATAQPKPSAKTLPKKPFLPPYQAPLPSAGQPERHVDPAVHKKIRRGRIDIDGTIDLHGMTQPAARAALHRFVQSSVSRGDRTVLVITGKGARTPGDYVAAMTERGILRTMLPLWLSDPGLSPLISGWSLAARGHGGEGAWYVRLRQP